MSEIEPSQPRMSRDAKFGYGFLLVGAALPYLIEKLAGSPIAAALVPAVCLVVGLVFLYAGHRHGSKLVPQSRMAVTVTGILILGVIGGITWAIAHAISKNSPEPILTTPAPTPSPIPSPQPTPTPSSNSNTATKISIPAKSHRTKSGSPRPEQTGQCYLRTGGYFPMPFRNDVVLPTLLANPTETPVDDVDMMIMKLIYKDDRETEPSLVEGETQELHIGTCRAKLYLGMKDFNFSPGNHDKLAYRITIFTRYETWTEMVKLWKVRGQNNNPPRYCEEVTVLRGGNEQMVHFRDDDCD